MADVSYVANNSNAVTDKGTAQKVGRALAPVITDQGFMENTTDVLFQDYLTDGMGYLPMALIYESEFIGEEITNPAAMTSDMVLMYPTPDLYSQRVLIPVPGPRQSPVAVVANLIGSDPQLQRLAQEQYGFRYSNTAEFQQIISRHRIFGKTIIVPLQIQPARTPDPLDLLADVIDAAEGSHQCP
jgi:hypothetical protein